MTILVAYDPLELEVLLVGQVVVGVPVRLANGLVPVDLLPLCDAPFAHRFECLEGSWDSDAVHLVHGLCHLNGSFCTSRLPPWSVCIFLWVI